MDRQQFFHERHQHIVSSWFQSLHGDLSTRYRFEPPEDLLSRMNTAALAFRRAILDNYWGDLEEFITTIAQRRFSEGFKLSEVEKAFELYRQTLMPLLFAQIDQAELKAVMTRLQECMFFTITRFSEYFQGIHEDFVRRHNEILEAEIEARTHELAESRQKYKTLVEDINEGFFVLTDGRVVFANRAFARMHGCRHEQVLQASYLDFVAEEHREMVRRAYELGRAGRRPERIEYLRLHRDGTKLPTEIIAKRTVFGRQPANIGICRDTSERVELEKKTRETEKLKALAHQAASVAHEVGNPLSTVKMNLQLCARTETDQENLRLLQVSLMEVGQIERCLQEMMDISFPLRLSRQLVDLKELLGHCLDSIRKRLSSTGVKVSLRLGRRIEKIEADPIRLKQALVNLLFNAVEAQPSGGKLTITIRPGKKDKDNWVEILVSDRGPGVPREMLPYLFDPMFSQKAMGNGLGLYNVKRIIDAHGGSVRAGKNRAGGMSFCLGLPSR